MLAVIKNNPAIVVSLVVAAVVYVAGEIGFVLDEASVAEVIAPIVVGLLTRPLVTPANPA